MSVLAYSGSAENIAIPLIPQRIVDENGSICVKIPDKQLANKSLQVTTCSNRTYGEWGNEDRSSAFAALQKVVSVWKDEGIANQYLVYGKDQPDTANPFNWEVVPYENPSTIIGCIWQQFVVLWKITFGGTQLSETEKKNQTEEYKNLYENSLEQPQKQLEKVAAFAKGEDAFCRRTVYQCPL